jgi:hypothetical protein
MARSVYQRDLNTWTKDNQGNWVRDKAKPYTIYTGYDMWDRIARLMPNNEDFVQMLKDANASAGHLVIDPGHPSNTSDYILHKAAGYTPPQQREAPDATGARSQRFHMVDVEGTPIMTQFTKLSETPANIMHEYTHGLVDSLNVARNKWHTDPTIMNPNWTNTYYPKGAVANLLKSDSNFPLVSHLLSGYEIGENMPGSDEAGNLQEIPALVSEANYALDNPKTGGRFADYKAKKVGDQFEDWSGRHFKKLVDLTGMDENELAQAYQDFIGNVKNILGQGYKNADFSGMLKF